MEQGGKKEAALIETMQEYNKLIKRKERLTERLAEIAVKQKELIADINKLAKDI